MKWMLLVWLMWVPTKSSNRDLAPGIRDAGVLAFLACRQSTASVYALRSFFDRSFHSRRMATLLMLQVARLREFCSSEALTCCSANKASWSTCSLATTGSLEASVGREEEGSSCGAGSALESVPAVMRSARVLKRILSCSPTRIE